MGEQGIAGPQVTHGGAAEITGERNGGEDRRCRHRIKQGAKQQEGSDRKVQLDRNSQVRESIHDRLGLKNFMTPSRTSRSTITALIVRPAQSAFFETLVDAASADMNYSSEFFECEPGNAARRSNLSGLDAGALHIDHPGNAEPVGEHAEAVRPESFAEGHRDGGFFRERAEDALGFLDVGETDVDVKTLRLGVPAWSPVAHHWNC